MKNGNNVNSLGIQLDTETEIKRRKGLTISALRNLNKILKSDQDQY